MVDYEEMLDYPYEFEDGQKNIREYLRDLLLTLWQEQERFSGKRPFGDSGWDYDLYKPLIVGGFLKGKIDEDGCIEYVNNREGWELVNNLIKHVFNS